MTKKPADPRASKSKGLVYLEYILLALCLCSIALRTTFTEGPTMQSTSVASSATDSLYSLSVSTVLIFSFVSWIVWSFCSGRFSYRPTGMEIGLGILFIGAVIACFAASDKRLALTDVTVFLAPLLMALLLVQILDSPSKVKLVLVVIAALGVVSAYQCAEQLFFSNKMTIEQYEKDPQSLLEPMGIEQGSFQQFMFEHRLYSGGVRGFFTTRNSAGSFMLMTLFAALALSLNKLNSQKYEESQPLRSKGIQSTLPIITKLVSIPLRWTRTITVVTFTILFTVFSGIGRDTGGYSVTVVVLIAAILINTILSTTILYHGWMAIQDDYVRTTPGKAAGFLFIPIFNLYWIFVAIGNYGKGFNAFISRNRIPAGKLPEKLFITQCVLMILAILIHTLPYVVSTYVTLIALGGLVISTSVAIVGLFIMWQITNGANEVYSYITKLPCQRYKTINVVFDIAIALILSALILTKSKGAVIGLFFAVAAFAVLLLFGNRLRRYRKTILAICALAVVAGGLALVSYGLSHGRLPGGNSMLVRWQYWRAAAQMYADHPFAGVGPANFTHFYTRYKPAAALESVADPHNFPLSLLTQYGPLGLLGFLVMLFVPLWRATSPESGGPALKDGRHQPAFGTIATAFLIVISAAMLILRPILMRMGFHETFEVVLYVIVTMYIAPIAVFVIGFVVVAGPLDKTRDMISQMWDKRAVAGLYCAVLGVTLHNLTDFAIFEPGVLTTFWAIIACLVAIDSHTSRRMPLNLKAAPIVKVLTVTAALSMSYAYFSYILVPAVRTSGMINRANRAIFSDQFEIAHALLDKAAKADPLSTAALSMDGRLYLRQFEMTHSNSLQVLTRAAECLQTAIARNNAAFKDYERLTDAYFALGEIASPSEQSGWFNKAFKTASLSIERYPGCERLYFKRAQIAEYLGKAQTAIENYKKAIEIEDEYRAQFKLLYPKWQYAVSRLGEEKYRLATERVRKLSEKSGE